jgi:hypothetical protein
LVFGQLLSLLIEWAQPDLLLALTKLDEADEKGMSDPSDNWGARKMRLGHCWRSSKTSHRFFLYGLCHFVW